MTTKTMTYADRAATVEHLLEELGDPPIVALTLYQGSTTLQLVEPLEGLDWVHSVSNHGDHWRVPLERDGELIELCAFKPVVLS